MIIMPGNDYSQINREYCKKYPDKIAFMNTPDNFKKPIHAYAIDNGAFTRFDEKKYFELLNKIKQYDPPLFVACPDVVGCHDRTLALWNYYYPALNNNYGYPLAFVAQDGCEPDTVPPTADWIFIGGSPSTNWKTENIHKFIGERPVHVGRVNSGWLLEYCESLGVASVDGTGWFRARGRQYFDYKRWFEGNEQLQLFNY